MPIAAPRKNEKGFWVVEDSEYVIAKNKAHRELPSPMAGVSSKEMGAAPMVIFRLWKIGTRPAGGSELRDASGELVLHYAIADLPVSEVHNGAHGYAKSEYGDHVYRPDHWIAAGWRLMRDLPSDWRAHNAKVEAQAAKAELERGAVLNTVDAIRMLADEIRTGRTADAHVENSSAASVAGAAPEGDRAPAGRASRRGAGAASG